jgi:phosphate/sulfate permease
MDEIQVAALLGRAAIKVWPDLSRKDQELLFRAAADDGVTGTALVISRRRTRRSRHGLLEIARHGIPLVGAHILSALCLGVGTMIGYRRIVKTLGERLGKSHLVPAQGASAELVAAALISFAGFTGYPVSTTHVVTGGIAE